MNCELYILYFEVTHNNETISVKNEDYKIPINKINKNSKELKTSYNLPKLY